MKWNEVSVALHIASLRHTESIRMGLKDNHGYTGRDLHDNFYGVLGEMGFSKITGRYFPMTVNNFKDADVGDKWQIRTVGSNKNRSLIVRYADPDHHFYALREAKSFQGSQFGIENARLGADVSSSDALNFNLSWGWIPKQGVNIFVPYFWTWLKASDFFYCCS